MSPTDLSSHLISMLSILYALFMLDVVDVVFFGEGVFYLLDIVNIPQEYTGCTISI